MRSSINKFISTAEEQPSASLNTNRDLPTTSTKIPSFTPSVRPYSSFIYDSKNVDQTYFKSKFFTTGNTSPTTMLSSDMYSSLPSSRLSSPLLCHQKSAFSDEIRAFSTNTTLKHSYFKDSLKKRPSGATSPTHPEKPDVIEEVDSFLQNYDKLKTKTSDQLDRSGPEKSEKIDKPGDVHEVITKLFTADANSELLADKLIKIYERRRSLVADGDNMPDADVEKISDTRSELQDVRTTTSGEISGFLTGNEAPSRNDGPHVGAEQYVLNFFELFATVCTEFFFARVLL